MVIKDHIRLSHWTTWVQMANEQLEVYMLMPLIMLQRTQQLEWVIMLPITLQCSSSRAEPIFHTPLVLKTMERDSIWTTLHKSKQQVSMVKMEKGNSEPKIFKKPLGHQMDLVLVMPLILIILSWARGYLPLLEIIPTNKPRQKLRIDFRAKRKSSFTMKQ